MDIIDRLSTPPLSKFKNQQLQKLLYNKLAVENQDPFEYHAQPKPNIYTSNKFGNLHVVLRLQTPDYVSVS